MKAKKPTLLSVCGGAAMVVLCAVMLGAMVLTSAGSAQAQQVGGVFGGHCYKVFTNQVTWLDAAAYCEQQGGHLATISSVEENQFLYDLLPPSVDQCWLGGSDQIAEGTWEWVTGEPFTYTNWGPGEPNNCAPGPNPELGEDYLTFHGREAYDPPLPGVWNDWQYEEDGSQSVLPFVCEYEPGPGNSPLAYAAWGGSLAQWAPPSFYDDPEDVRLVSWSLKVRLLWDGAVGHLGMNVARHDQFPVGHYRTTNIVGSLFALVDAGDAYDPSDDHYRAIVVFRWDFPFRYGAVWNKVVLDDYGSNKPDTVKILSSPEYVWVEVPPAPGFWMPFGDPVAGPWLPLLADPEGGPLPTNNVQVLME